jgi:hypothetical protein
LFSFLSFFIPNYPNNALERERLRSESTRRTGTFGGRRERGVPVLLEEVRVTISLND